ncbi:UDP-N-acetylmuramoyl-L-alanine--D-glutamate ligase [Gallicola sp. Sow4_E12]|uniref:UDP-N-acetylmuramoyl-L-alanine--D-glutamate ligase n=1 Tax=Gallicola sp. Sow4_E12 TaxID=3438785 RepID=UPI003F8FD7F8
MEKYLVYGLGISGISSVKTLCSLKNEVYIYDEKNEEDLKDVFKELEGYNYTWIKDIDEGLEKAEVLLKSPGIPVHNPIVKKALEKGLEVVSDLELVTRLFPDRKIVAVTGTNGKTTTTTLMKEILIGCGLKAKAIGNIGLGMLWEIYNGEKNEVFVIECSSFQLANTYKFHPQYSAIINISPDHLDWHGNYEEYIKAKKNIFKNQNSSDFMVINIDNPELNEMLQEIPSRIIKTNANEQSGDVFVEEGKIYSKLDGKKDFLLKVEDIPIKGSHNVENVLIALGLSLAMNLDMEKAGQTIRTFQAVEHRLEFVREIKGVEYYNDSKGTNVDASIKAIEAFHRPIILLAGGYDKKADLTPLFEVMKNRVKHLVLFGATRELFAEYAADYGIKAELVESMYEAVNRAHCLSDEGDIVLLSPASAAWGMYDNFEIRGRDFKKKVREL